MGLLQSVADMFKILIKRLIELKHIDRFLFRPGSLSGNHSFDAGIRRTALGQRSAGNRLQHRIFFLNRRIVNRRAGHTARRLVIANNKFTLIGALRSGCTDVSYETVDWPFGTHHGMPRRHYSVGGIIEAQSDMWFIFKGHIPALIAFVILHDLQVQPKPTRPFDLPEAESEAHRRLPHRVLRYPLRLLLSGPNTSTCS